MVLMWTELLNDFSLIKKNQYQQERSQRLSYLTHQHLKRKKMKSLLDRQCLLGLDIDPEVQSHTVTTEAKG